MIKYCERCNREHNGQYGTGRFCSKKCAYTRKYTEEQKLSRSIKMKGHNYNKGQIPWNKGKKVSGIKKKYYAPNLIPLKDILDGKREDLRSLYVRDRYLAAGILEDKCCKCGWSKKRKGYRWSTCHLHHKDGNKRNHRKENVVLLCPNCHSLTDSYCKRKDSVGKVPNRTYDYRNKQIVRRRVRKNK